MVGQGKWITTFELYNFKRDQPFKRDRPGLSNLGHLIILTKNLYGELGEKKGMTLARGER